MKKICKKSLSGFTITELSLTMSFVAVLLITIAIITTNILAIYQKGTTIKAVNNVGRGLVDEFTRAISAAPVIQMGNTCEKITDQSAQQACIADQGSLGYIYNSAENSDRQQLYGVFCTGSYSYIWNTPQGFAEDKTLSLTYHNANGDQTIEAGEATDKDALTLLKIKDTTHRVCTAAMDIEKYQSIDDWGNKLTLNATKYVDNADRTLIMDDPEMGLLLENDTRLFLYEVAIFPRSSDQFSGRAFYAGTFVLATERGGIDIKNSDNFCVNSETSSTGNLGAEFNYCALNKFNFAARTAGA